MEDVNDNPPVFSPERYVTSISSHAQPGTELLSVFASDQDSGNYGEITYELLPGDSAPLFTVDKSTGKILYYSYGHTSKKVFYFNENTKTKGLKCLQRQFLCFHCAVVGEGLDKCHADIYKI